ncbi:MAG TPA: ATP-grasp domain-containing protein, partial [Chloroflexota bacterium]|nr:ATP-grasp domain-containing protein [Chloroflexota bacterium]
GQGIEFDYGCVHCVWALKEGGYDAIIINNNPETVSTDFDTSDRLYFEPLTVEDVLAVIDCESPIEGIIVQFGGQTAINLVHALTEQGVRILGTPPDSIDAAEDRARSSAILRREGIPSPRWVSIDRWEDLSGAVATVGFPALLRPSYVLSGRGMVIVRTPEEVERYLAAHGHQSLDKPLLVDHFLEGAVELDVDAVSDGEEIVSVVMEQIEECGVHSGDSCEVYPTQTIAPHVLETVERYTGELARAFGIVGLMNVQYAIEGDAVYVLEVNPRASRSVPFASKASGIPLTSLAIQVILGRKLRDLAVPAPRTDHVSVKSVVFPFRVFPDLTPVAGPEMQSTGESMGIGRDFPTAYWKARLGGGWKELPFGRPVYVAPGSESPELCDALAAAGCRIVEGAPGSIDAGEVSLTIVLGRSQEEIGLLQRCVTVGTPAVTTAGAVRGLVRALSARPCDEVIAHAAGPVLGAVKNVGGIGTAREIGVHGLANDQGQ